MVNCRHKQFGKMWGSIICKTVARDHLEYEYSKNRTMCWLNTMLWWSYLKSQSQGHMLVNVDI